MRRGIPAIGVAVLAAMSLAACGGGGKAGNENTVQLSEQSSSGESGTATLTADGDRTEVVIELENGTATPQPAHIHKGSCANLDPTPAFPLNNVVDGKSTSEVNVSLSDLEKSAYAINVHMSAQDVKTYVACGDIGGTGGSSGDEGGDGY